MRIHKLHCLYTILLNLVLLVSSADQYSREDFPPGFVFGAASSAFQYEGAAHEYGRSPSVWDTFSNGRGAMGIDGYHKYKEDIKLMAETGLEAYRLSISWSRLIPNGRGPVNPKGLEYYDNVLNELTKHGIEVHVTLYHFDHPQILEEEYAGWLSRKIVKDFTDFAEVCFREFGDRVSSWATINEPNILAMGAYDQGILPPGRCSYPFGFNCSKGNSTFEPYLAAHHMLLAHASAVKLYREKYQAKQHGVIGITLYTLGFIPLTNSKEDVTATQRAKDFMYGWFINPLVFGEYPDVIKKNARSRLPAFTSQESELVKGALDFLGVIHYSTVYVQDNSKVLKVDYRDYLADMAAALLLDPDIPYILVPDEYPIRPEGLQGLLQYFKQAYGNLPVYIHENGQLSKHNASLQDTSRVEYLQAYIGSVLEAIRNGSNTRGYFVWSFFDLFELLDDYRSSFGLYFVDYDDPNWTRQPKQSAYWYSNFLKGERISFDETVELQNNLKSSSGFVSEV